MKSMIHQVRAFQQTGEPFWIELASGRIVQVYSASSVATTENCAAVLWDCDFQIIAADQIVTLGSGIHEEERKRLEKLKAEIVPKQRHIE